MVDGEQTLVLIRPDGYIALISDRGEVSSVVEYFGSIQRGRQ